MFIELTDHLRCPADHDEAYLVLLPQRMDGRSVVAGDLGCPVCGRTFRIENGELDVGGTRPLPAGHDLSTRLDASAILALAGIGGPGGYFVLVGSAGAEWPAVAAAMPGIGLVAVNPAGGVPDAPAISVLRGDTLPLKTNSVRGVVLGPGYGGDERWVREAARVTLPGLRVVGEGETPGASDIELMASADGVWVGTRRR